MSVQFSQMSQHVICDVRLPKHSRQKNRQEAYCSTPYGEYGYLPKTLLGNLLEGDAKYFSLADMGERFVWNRDVEDLADWLPPILDVHEE